jgi:hypothetical protein
LEEKRADCLEKIKTSFLIFFTPSNRGQSALLALFPRFKFGKIGDRLQAKKRDFLTKIFEENLSFFERELEDVCRRKRED